MVFIMNTATAQDISFGASGLIGETTKNPTSLDFGPDGKLYVAQQNGTIWQYTVTRNNANTGTGNYTIDVAEQINLVKTNIPNHTDDGVITIIKERQVTGILTAGTPETPILYVTSSDNLIGGGGAAIDRNLDTNSGVISKLTWNGSAWDKIDLVRGLPRCEENHAINGMDIFERNGETYMLVQQGGHANKGAPSNNFVGTPEYLLSGALLIVNLSQLENMAVFTDPRSNTQYVYDLPTLNDPTREDITNSDIRFPYTSDHPMYNATIDVSDPFGGNDGLNQAFAETGGPVQVFSPGYRNAFDVVVREDGSIYTFDNGPNTGWGGLPLIYDNTGTLKGDESTTTYAPENGDYVTNEFNEIGSSGHGDALHYVGTINDANGTYYGGHPRPIAAFPGKADLITYKNIEGNWVETLRFNLNTTLNEVSGYFNATFSIADFPDDPRQGKYLGDAINSSEINILDIINSSTNGMCEYTASNFDNALKGSLLSASFNGNIYRHVPSAAGDTYTTKEILLNGFGSVPLDVIALPDDHIFAGTIWAATYGSDNITVFEPMDAPCPSENDSNFDPMADSDNDGYTNQDELDNNTNFCSGGSTPKDFDGDRISDLNDLDDDNDGIPDTSDAFAIDPTNGTTTYLPVKYPFWNNDPGTGFFGLGFTGLMLDPSGNTDYLTQFDETNISFGGAAGKASIDLIPKGDPIGGNNSADYGFQFGINVDRNSNPFTVHSRIESPFFGIDGMSTDPGRYQAIGIFIGNGDQDNYLKVVLGYGTTPTDTVDGVEILLENAGANSGKRYNIPGLLDGNAVDIFISINPSQNTAQPYVSADNSTTLTATGPALSLPSNFLESSDAKGMAVGLIATSFGTGPEFSGIWDFINVTEDRPGILTSSADQLDFGTLSNQGNPTQLFVELNNESGPADPVIEITEVTITGADAALFSTDLAPPKIIGSGGTLLIPLTAIADTEAGNKTAVLQVVHSGQNSPLQIPITATVKRDFEPLLRINAAGTLIAASDDGPDWLPNTNGGASSTEAYSVNTGNNAQFSHSYENKHNSIPDYIDEATYEAIFTTERWDSGVAPEMEYTIPIANGTYIVNLFMANNYIGTTAIGDRIYDILIEDVLEKDDVDLIAEFGGTKIGGMFSFPVTVTDSLLNINFIHQVENPLINAIEILRRPDSPITPLVLNTIEERTDTVGTTINLAVATTGGDPSKNYTYTISGQPDGIDIEPTNGHIFGTIAETALDGGIAHDGIHNVIVTVEQEGLTAVNTEFIWVTIPDEFSITTPENQTNSDGDMVSLPIETTGGGTSITYNASGLPPGLAIDENTGLISGTIQTEAEGSGAYLEKDGIVVIEAESAALGSTSWTIEEHNNETALVAGTNNFGSQQGTSLSYDIQFDTPGVYRLVFRSDFSGSNPTDENDSWLRFINNDDVWFFAQSCYTCSESSMITNLQGTQENILFPKGSSRVTENTTPRGSGAKGYFKSYRIGTAGWSWSTNTNDGSSYPIYVWVTTPGIHTLELAERSHGHRIDKLAMYRVSGTSLSNDQLDALPISDREGGSTNQGSYDVSVTATSNTNTAAIDFSWTLTPPATQWIDKEESENYVSRHECSFVQAGDKFIMFGGRESSQQLDVYDYASDTWSQGGEAPVEFNHFQAVTYKGLVWVICAFKNNSFPNETPSEYIYTYNPASQEWIQGIEIPEARRRGGAGLVVHNDKFYCVGGNTIGHNGGYVSWFDEYDPATGIWTALTDAPHARDHFHATIADGKLYAAGGRLSGGDGGVFAPLVPEVDVYDFASGTWTVLEQHLPTPRAAAGVVTFENEIYVMGGETATSNVAYDTVEAYNPATNTWETKTSMHYPRHGTQAIASGSGIYIAGGSPKRGGGSQRNMEVYHQDAPEGTPIVDSELVPNNSSVVFKYTQDQDRVPIAVIVSNTGGDTAKYIKSVRLTGDNYSMNTNYDQRFLDVNTSLSIAIALNDTSIAQSNGNLTITYDNNEEINVVLDGSQGLPQEETIIYRINAGGLEINDVPISWDADLAAIYYGIGVKGEASPYVNSEADSRSLSSPYPAVFTNPTLYNDSLFQTMRFSIYSAPRNQQWDFPVANGAYTVNLLLNEMWFGGQEAGKRIFDIYIEDQNVAPNFDVTGTFGWQTAGIASFSVEVTDENLDIDFGKLLESPIVGGIEIIQLTDIVPDNNAIRTAANGNVTIHPVPATETITATISNGDRIQDIQLIDSRTNAVLIEVLNSNQTEVEINVGDLDTGIYIIGVTAISGETTWKTISIN